MAVQKFHLCKDKLPYIDGIYEVKYNTEVNGGGGQLRYTKRAGWNIPDSIKHMYIVVGWYENVKE